MKTRPASPIEFYERHGLLVVARCDDEDAAIYLNHLEALCHQSGKGPQLGETTPPG